MGHRFKAVCAAAALAIVIAPAHAEDQSTWLKPLERPDPAAIKMPALPLSFSPKEQVDSDSYFYFHKDGVSYEAAFADLDLCRLYARSAKQFTLPPKFVALGTEVITRNYTVPNTQWYYTQYGIVGGAVADVMFAIIVAQVEEDNQNATMRRCMAYKGYKRYGLPRTVYKKIDSDLAAEKLARLALLASGPQPLTTEAGQ